MRTDALAAQAQTDSKVYVETVKLGHDIAEMLRKNVVQAHKVDPAKEDEDIWRR